MKKILFLATLGLLFAAGNADAKAVKLGKSDDGGARIAAAKEKRAKPVKCAKGEFKNSNGECVGCTVANCAECKAAGVCKRCNANYTLLDGGTCGCKTHDVCGDKQICENKICVDLPCPDGYYASEHKCKACSSNCLTCSDQNTCTSCETGKYLSGGSCNGCSAKFSHCLECDSTKCTKCDGETDKINGVCVEDESGCKTSADCAEDRICNDSHECEACPEGYVKQGDSCVPNDSEDECSVDEECDENEKCEYGGCVLKKCKEINNSYKTSCAANETATATGVTGFDGDCVTCAENKNNDDEDECKKDADCETNKKCSDGACVPKTCAEIDPSYKTECKSNEKASSTPVPGCVTCSEKSCIDQSTAGSYWYPLDQNCPSGTQQVGTTPQCRICKCLPFGVESGTVANFSTVHFAASEAAYNAFVAWQKSGNMGCAGVGNLASAQLCLYLDPQKGKFMQEGISSSYIECSLYGSGAKCTHRYVPGKPSFTVSNVKNIDTSRGETPTCPCTRCSSLPSDPCENSTDGTPAWCEKGMVRCPGRGCCPKDIGCSANGKTQCLQCAIR